MAADYWDGLASIHRLGFGGQPPAGGVVVAVA